MNIISFSPTLKKAGKGILDESSSQVQWSSPVVQSSDCIPPGEAAEAVTIGERQQLKQMQMWNSSWSGRNRGAAADVVKEMRPLKHT